MPADRLKSLQVPAGQNASDASGLSGSPWERYPLTTSLNVPSPPTATTRSAPP